MRKLKIANDRSLAAVHTHTHTHTHTGSVSGYLAYKKIGIEKIKTHGHKFNVSFCHAKAA